MKTPTINSRILKLEVLKGTATRASVNAVESRTTSLESDVATAQSDISTLQGNVATLTQGIADAVSTHNTAPDAHADIRTALAGKQDSLTISDVGEALLNLSTPTAVRIPRINADASVTLIDVPSNVEEVDADFVSISYYPSGGGGGSSITEVTPVWPVVTTTHTFEAFGDSNGLIYAATGLGQPVVLSTSGSVGGGSLSDLIDRGTDDIYISGAVGTWVQLDFGANCTVSPNYFAIRNNSNNYDPLRNWEWRGSNDLTTWTVLDTRVNDATLSTASVWGGWSPNGELEGSYRYLRLVRTGATGGGGANYIRIGELEVYGSYAAGEIQALPSWATVWLSDGAYVWPGRPI